MEDNENINKDPDVSPTNSWVFVENSAVNNESGPSSADHAKNETKIEELNADDLGGSSSSSCDSDGISVISEAECFKNHCCGGGSFTNTSEEDDTSENDGYNKYNEFLNGCCTSEDDDDYLRNINGRACFLNGCCSNEDYADDSDFRNTNETECSVKGCYSAATDNEVLRNAAMLTDNTNNGFTLASTVAGVCIFITYILLSNYHMPPAAYHDADMTIDDYDDEMLLWTSYDDNDTCEFNILSEINTDLINLMMPRAVAMKPSKLLANTIYHENANKKYTDKRDKQMSRNSNNIKKNKKTNKKTQTEHLKQQENYLKKKEKYLTKREKHLKKLEKHIVTMESRFRRFFDKMKQIQRQFEDKAAKTKKSKSNTTTANGGEWYEKMYFGRSEIRHRERLSDWMFERSKMRNKLRNKAHWYFNRANGREAIRSADDLRSGKRNHFKTYRY